MNLGYFGPNHGPLTSFEVGIGQPLSLVAVFRGRTSGNTVFPSQVEDGELFSEPLHFSGRGWFDTKNH
jgi:hypothetical protein